ncbi:HAMP domain-containing protein [candidate division KSB1 bacterium]|nr:HAMP domain-containing protein [candidate division KSB1 bacterium]
MNWISSIKFKLTVWNALVVMLIYAVAAVWIYFFMKNRLESQLSAKLENGLDIVATVVFTSGGDVCDWYHLGQDTPFLVFRNDTLVYQTKIWPQMGLTLGYSTRDFESDTLKTEFIERRSYLLKSRLVRTGMDKLYDFLVIYAIESTETRQTIDGLAAKLASGIQFIFILAVLGGYLLARRALYPIKALTNRALHISASSLSQRLPVVNPRDEIGQLTAVFNDVLQRLEVSFERLKRFTSDASHEFRTPLTAIRSIGEVALKDKRNNAEYRKAISSILEETNRLTDLVDSLLVLTRADSGKVKLEFAQVDLVSMTAAVLEELKVLAEEKNIKLIFFPKEKINAHINASIFRQALMNVLHNAINYTPRDGKITIDIVITKTKRIQIDVTDTGPGIPAHQREKVFERFFRLDDARSSSSGGAGLGLSIARWAVEINGGSISFVDFEGTGARCRILI